MSKNDVIKIDPDNIGNSDEIKVDSNKESNFPNQNINSNTSQINNVFFEKEMSNVVKESNQVYSNQQHSYYSNQGYQNHQPYQPNQGQNQQWPFPPNQGYPNGQSYPQNQGYSNQQYPYPQNQGYHHNTFPQPQTVDFNTFVGQFEEVKFTPSRLKSLITSSSWLIGISILWILAIIINSAITVVYSNGTANISWIAIAVIWTVIPLIFLIWQTVMLYMIKKSIGINMVEDYKNPYIKKFISKKVYCLLPMTSFGPLICLSDLFGDFVEGFFSFIFVTLVFIFLIAFGLVFSIFSPFIIAGVVIRNAKNELLIQNNKSNN